MDGAPPREGSASEWAERLSQAISGAVLGQSATVERLQTALIAGGNVLLEGMPGLAKTLLVKSVAQAMGLRFERIQFTPDLLPSDVVGTMVYSSATGAFTPHPGPIFANLVLADEINRAPAKVQSALLEAMQEKQVTLGGETRPLPDPFFVMATQNPIEQEGTYRLPEAQMDRFLFKLDLGYPSEADELSMMRLWRSAAEPPQVDTVSDGRELLTWRRAMDTVHVAAPIESYMLALVRRTRDLAEEQSDGRRVLQNGASPRATLALHQASRALALIRGRDHVDPGLVQEIAPDVLRHRLSLTYEALAEGATPDSVVADTVRRVAVPAA